MLLLLFVVVQSIDAGLLVCFFGLHVISQPELETVASRSLKDWCVSKSSLPSSPAFHRFAYDAGQLECMPQTDGLVSVREPDLKDHKPQQLHKPHTPVPSKQRHRAATRHQQAQASLKIVRQQPTTVCKRPRRCDNRCGSFLLPKHPFTFTSHTHIRADLLGGTSLLCWKACTKSQT